MKIAYIAHPIGGNVKRNIERLEWRIRYINMTEPDVVPFAHYLTDIRVLNDDDPNERARGMRNNEALLTSGVVDELRLYGHTISKGMRAEIEIAREMGIPIIPMTDATKDEYKSL